MSYAVLPDSPETTDLLGGYEPDPVRWRHLVGEMVTTYARLVELFGEPIEAVRDPEKSDAAWAIQFEDGSVADIYNYKDGRVYLGRRGKRPQHITEWHVGAVGDEVFDRVVAIVQPEVAGSVEELYG